MIYSEYERFFLWAIIILFALFSMLIKKRPPASFSPALDTDRELNAAIRDDLRFQSARTVFLQHLNHEMRNPINAALGFSQITAALCDSANPNVKKIQEYTELTAHSVAELKKALAELERFCAQTENPVERTATPVHKFAKEAYVTTTA